MSARSLSGLLSKESRAPRADDLWKVVVCLLCAARDILRTFWLTVSLLIVFWNTGSSSTAVGAMSDPHNLPLHGLLRYPHQFLQWYLVHHSRMPCPRNTVKKNKESACAGDRFTHNQD